jgi:hypothetical protein
VQFSVKNAKKLTKTTKNQQNQPHFHPILYSELFPLPFALMPAENILKAVFSKKRSHQKTKIKYFQNFYLLP